MGISSNRLHVELGLFVELPPIDRITELFRLIYRQFISQKFVFFIIVDIFIMHELFILSGAVLLIVMSMMSLGVNNLLDDWFRVHY